MRREATYTGLDGVPFAVSYDDNAPCVLCGQPVSEASMGGTAVCPWCDCGVDRNGRPLWPKREGERGE